MNLLETFAAPERSDAAGWPGRLDLEIRRTKARSELARRVHRGPLRIQRPFYPEGNEHLHLYLLHPPGGMVGGDRLDLKLELGPEAAALITTPSAQKLYRSEGRQCTQEVSIRIGRGATLEWFPGETLIFNGAHAKFSTRLDLEQDAACVAWEIGCFGRPASRLPFVRGHFTQSFEIYREGTPLLVERNRVAGGSEALEAAWGYAGCASYGTLYAAPRSSGMLGQLLDRLRRSPRFCGSDRVSVTALDELLVVRALAQSVEGVRRALIEAWIDMRKDVLGRPACLPRIWAT